MLYTWTENYLDKAKRWQLLANSGKYTEMYLNLYEINTPGLKVT